MVNFFTNGNFTLQFPCRNVFYTLYFTDELVHEYFLNILKWISLYRYLWYPVFQRWPTNDYLLIFFLLILILQTEVYFICNIELTFSCKTLQENQFYMFNKKLKKKH